MKDSDSPSGSSIFETWREKTPEKNNSRYPRFVIVFLACHRIIDSLIFVNLFSHIFFLLGLEYLAQGVTSKHFLFVMVFLSPISATHMTGWVLNMALFIIVYKLGYLNIISKISLFIQKYSTWFCKCLIKTGKMLEVHIILYILSSTFQIVFLSIWRFEYNMPSVWH